MPHGARRLGRRRGVAHAGEHDPVDAGVEHRARSGRALAGREPRTSACAPAACAPIDHVLRLLAAERRVLEVDPDEVERLGEQLGRVAPGSVSTVPTSTLGSPRRRRRAPRGSPGRSGDAPARARRAPRRWPARSISATDASLSPAMCGLSTTFGSASSGEAASGGSCLEHVERRAAQLAPHERARERLLVDDRAARGVDEDRGRAHPAQLGRADQQPRAREQRGVQRHDVGGGEQLRPARRAPRPASGTATGSDTRMRAPKPRTRSATSRPMRP